MMIKWFVSVIKIGKYKGKYKSNYHNFRKYLRAIYNRNSQEKFFQKC